MSNTKQVNSERTIPKNNTTNKKKIENRSKKYGQTNKGKIDNNVNESERKQNPVDVKNPEKNTVLGPT